MSHASNFINAFAFRTVKDGTWYFYPFGIVGPAYAVHSEETRARIHSFYSRALPLILVVCAIAMSMPMFPMLLTLVGGAALFGSMQWSAIQELPDLVELDRTESTAIFFRDVSCVSLVGGAASSFSFVLLATLSLFILPSQHVADALLLAGLFAVFTAVFLGLLIKKARFAIRRRGVNQAPDKT